MMPTNKITLTLCLKKSSNSPDIIRLSTVQKEFTWLYCAREFFSFQSSEGSHRKTIQRCGSSRSF